MRILFLIEGLPPGGAERQLVILMNALCRLGHTVHLLTWVDNDFFKQPDIPEVHWTRQIRKNRWDFSPVLKASQLILKHKMEAIQGFLNTGNLYAVIAGFLSGKSDRVYCSERSAMRILGFWAKLHKPFAHRKSVVTICNSNEGSRFVLSLGVSQDKVHIIRNAFIRETFVQPEDYDKNSARKAVGLHYEFRYGLCVARFAVVKNHHGIVQALAKLTLPEDFKMLFVGDGNTNDIDWLKKEIKTLGLERHFEFRNSSDKVQKYYWAADFFVLFSNFEGSPNTPIEAMLAGMPLVVSNVGDIAHYLSQDSFVVQPGDIDGLSKYLSEFIKMPIEDLKNHGQANFSRLLEMDISPEHMANAYLTVYTNKAKA